MPILENERYELFAQLLAQGKTAQQAYSDAGYKPSRKNAWRLKTNKDIAARVLELQGVAAAGAKITLEGLLDELEHARQRADSLGQLSASVRAISEKARLAGLVVERQQVEVITDQHEPESREEVLAYVCGAIGIEAAKALAIAFKLEFDEPAILALCNGQDVPHHGGYSQRLIEERRPIVNGRKREIS